MVFEFKWKGLIAFVLIHAEEKQLNYSLRYLATRSVNGLHCLYTKITNIYIVLTCNTRM